MDNNRIEQVIDLRELIIVILKKWRIIIISALIFSIFLGGYKCIKGSVGQSDDKYMLQLNDKYKNDLEEYKQLKKWYDWKVESLTKSIASQEEYIENSILLKIDPYNKYTASVDIFVKISDLEGGDMAYSSVDPTNAIVKAYVSEIIRGNSLVQFSKDKGVDLSYLKELIKISFDYESNMFNVTISYIDQLGAEEILNTILNSMDSLHSDVQQKFGQHNIIVMDQDTNIVTDRSLEDYQKQKLSDLPTMKDTLKDTEKALEELREPQEPTALSRILIIKEGVKYGLLGGIFGICLSAFSVCILFLMSNKISSESDLHNRFGLTVLGCFERVNNQSHFNTIDNKAGHLSEEGIISSEEVYDKIALYVNTFVTDEQSIFLTGKINGEVLQELSNELQKKIPQFQLGFGSDVDRSVMALQMMSGFDNIILVEERGKAKYSDVQNEIDTVLSMKKNIIGCIVL